MRWLAIDPGRSRVGLAICDAEERLSVPLEVLPRKVAVPAIRAIVARERVGGVVLGLPLLPSGAEGEAAQMARKLGDRLTRVLGVPLLYEDERLTSVQARELLREARGPTGAAVDDLAAQLLLEQFLSRRRPHGSGRQDSDATA